MGEHGTGLALEFRPNPLSGFGDQVSPLSGLPEP